MVQYLLHVISAAGVSTDPRKVTGVDDWANPHTMSELRSVHDFLKAALQNILIWLEEFIISYQPVTVLPCLTPKLGRRTNRIEVMGCESLRPNNGKLSGQTILQPSVCSASPFHIS